MDNTDGVADLHIHTTASDGTCSVTDRVEQANERDLDAIAVTDHDSISADIECRATCYEETILIAGVEIRADVEGTKVELLGYYIDPNDSDLMTVLKEVRDYRRERNRRIIDRLHQLTSLNRDYTDIREEASGILGRPHIATVLVEEGIVSSVGEAFDTFLGSDGAAFVSMKRVAASRLIEVIHNAGGVVSLAHPGRIRTDSIERIVAALAADGLDAIEVQYPYDETPKEGYADIGVEDAAVLANKYDLLKTGGSDCHGPDSGKFRIGDCRINRENLEVIRKRAEERQELES